MSGITNLSASGTPTQTATNGSMSTQMQQLGVLLNEFSLAVMKMEGDSETAHYTIGSTILEQIKTNTNDLISAVKKQAALESADNAASGFEKIVGYIMNAVQGISCIITQQWGMLAMTAGFTALSASGAITDIEEDIASDLQHDDPHMSATCAKFIADIITVVVIVAASAVAMKGASSLSALKSAPEEMALLDDTASETEEAAAAQEPPKAEKGAGTLSRLVLVGSQAVMASNFSADAAAYAASGVSSQNGKVAVEIALGLIVSLGAAIAGVVAVKNLSTNIESSLSSETKGIGRYLSYLASTKVGVNLFRGSNILADAALVAQTGSEISKTVTNIELGTTTKVYARANSSIVLFKALMNLFENQFSQYCKVANNQLQGINSIIAAIGKAYTKVNEVEVFRA